LDPMEKKQSWEQETRCQDEELKVDIRTSTKTQKTRKPKWKMGDRHQPDSNKGGGGGAGFKTVIIQKKRRIAEWEGWGKVETRG